ncbi:MAG: N-6 DNA methylase [Eubacterium sp.]|nr:N-6 DNA methylase [Eubacterium sp.]
MSKASEETTKGLTADMLSEIPDYPSKQNNKVDGITWFKEDSYKGTDYNWISDVFSKASKKQTMGNKGTPDFMVVKDNSNVIIVIECKAETNEHSRYSNIEEYKLNGFGSSDDTEKYAIDGALWYASFLSDNYDVVAIAISGQTNIKSRITSFVWPKNAEVSDIEIITDGTLEDDIPSINQYEKDIDIVLERFAETEAEVKKELRRYTLSCANFLRANGIEDNSKAGFVSAIILGLTNHESKLYKDTKSAIDGKRVAKSKRMLSDSIGRSSVKMLKAALYGDGNEYEDDYVRGIWDIDKIPKGKRTALRKFYNNLLSKDELLRAPKGENRDFTDGDTVLSRCIYSLYENVIEILEHYSGIDVMGEFYTTFLRFTKGNAKEKGIVLTPKHITELFCDIAEYYSDKKLTETTKVLDICCGTGAFLISALARIKENISAQKISETEKNNKYSSAQKNSLIGVERDPSMYALAYANMRFHGDGKSNLFNCSSLLVDSYAPVDDSGKTYLNDNDKIPLHEALASFGDIDIAMINPPYSLDKKDNSSSQNYEIIKRKEEYEGKINVLKKKLSQAKKKDSRVTEVEIKKIQANIEKQKILIERTNKELEDTRMDEVVFSKGQDELDFVAAMLHYLKDGGIGIAIVPMSCAGNSGEKLRAEILQHHTLLACMTMPANVFFDSHVGTATCIMVFKAHYKHDEDKSVFFARWQDDGFKVIPHNGRKDSGAWNCIRKEWVDQIDGTAAPNQYIWLKKKISICDEALAEAYIETDYSNLSDSDFEITLKKYALFKYMDENGLLEN